MILLFPLIFVFVGWLIFGKNTTNPYIKTHKRKWKNEVDYREYIKWLDEQGGDLPLKEVQFKDDVEIIKEVSKHINR